MSPGSVAARALVVRVVVVTLVGAPSAQVDRRTDESGVTHRSTHPHRIPPRCRDRVDVLERFTPTIHASRARATLTC